MLPILEPEALDSSPIADTCASGMRPAISRTFDETSVRRSARLLGSADLHVGFDVLRKLLSVVRFPCAPPVLVLADPSGVYVAGEFAEDLAFFVRAISMVTLTRTREVLTAVAAVRPSTVVWTLERPVPSFDRSVKSVVTFGRPAPRPPRARWFDFLRDPFVGIFAVSTSGSTYRYSPAHHYLETAADGTLLLTSFANLLQPVLRLRTGIRARVTRPGTFRRR